MRHSTLAAAEEYLGRGWAPIPIPFRKKGPTLQRWPDLRLTKSDLPRYFNGTLQNIGVLLGEPSGGLIDVDLDSREALMLASKFLPPTRYGFGRTGKPESHWLYRVATISRTIRYQALDGSVLLEVRSTGCQTLFPPSVHPNGESIGFFKEGEPEWIEQARLLAATGNLAAASLLARHWPETGGRQEAALALAGGLLRNGWDEDTVNHFIGAVAFAAGDDEISKRCSASDFTKKRLDAERAASGWPRLADMLGDDIVRKVREWLKAESWMVTHDIKESPRDEWPELDATAWEGLPGELTKTIAPHSEADPVAILLHILVGAGCLIGRKPHVLVEYRPHFARLNALFVGRTAGGRKGTAWSTPKYVLSQVDKAWAADRILTGLSTGEGLIFQVRDPADKDPGEEDKRLLIIEEEFASTLKVMQREGNTLSPIIRSAWDDGGTLSPLTKKDRIRATDTHVCIIGHITHDELLRYLNATELGNGFANRFLFTLVRRTRLLPSGKGVPPELIEPFFTRFRRVLMKAKDRGELVRDADAEKYWGDIYPVLEEERPGMTGAILGRGAAKVLRLSMIYALLDETQVDKERVFIRVPHIKAAQVVWNYCKASVEYIFGDSLGDPVADKLLAAIKIKPQTDTDLYTLLGKRDEGRKEPALKALLRLGLVHSLMITGTGGRARNEWHPGTAEKCVLCVERR